MHRRYKFKSDFARGYCAEGERAGLLTGLLRAHRSAIIVVLQARGFPVSERIRENLEEIDSPTDLDDLLRRAAVVMNAVELFEAAKGDSADGPESGVSGSQESPGAPQEYEFQTDFVREFFGVGWREGRRGGMLEARRKDIVAFLEARKLRVPVPIRKRINACSDIDELARLVKRAAVVATATELFA